MRSRRRDPQLVGPWRKLHAAIWLAGILILVWLNWVWPGILILVVTSLILEAILMQVAPQAFESTEPASPAAVVAAAMPQVTPPPEHRLELLPSSCPKCGAPIRGDEVKWTGPQSADCVYCGANLPMRGM